MKRNLCKVCLERPVAINYYKLGRTFYRTTCDHCGKKRKEGTPLWERHGYKKKNVCDKCGFQSKYLEQFSIFYIDGNPSNVKYNNLKTVCANCYILLYKLKPPWKQGDLIPDF